MEKLGSLYRRVKKLEKTIPPSDVKQITADFNELCRQEAQNEEWEFKKIIQWEVVLGSILEEALASSIGRTIPTLPCFELGRKIASWMKQRQDIPQLTDIAHHYLDFLRTPELRIRIYGQKKWEGLILNLIEGSRFTLRTMYYRNTERYASKTLFRVLKGGRETLISWKDATSRIHRIQEFMNRVLPDKTRKIALLMTNSPEMALIDLACLFSGRVNIMIAANSTPEHIQFILNQTEAELLFVSSSQLLEKIIVVKPELNYLKQAVFLPGNTRDPWVIPYELPASAKKPEEDELELDPLATLMYTSGTTGEPKGIMFSQKNIIFKRFCRALAIPKIGCRDRFLCFLPLFHTFGRFFEMTGCVFWGAEYTFMENPSIQTMVRNMRKVKPTVFISIPRKWIQLYERVGKKLHLEMAPAEEIKQALDAETGGHLKWGLSAAGYLPPEVFYFFQQNGVELMSGFGMTEATGGISMTPPGEYKPNSLGKALPGIDVKLADDGELLIKGAYVMLGYYKRPIEKSFLSDGWMPTGDIMKQDTYGCLEIIDRKKEIYKNVRGETVAPQKVENLFRDFEEIQQVFLVGDHRPYNTVLLYPNPEKQDFFDQLDASQTQDYFSSVVTTVNRFLSPFERILDYRVIDRPFSAEKGELTPKNTYRRKTIETNFQDLVEEMYKRLYYPLFIGELEVQIPNWFMSEKGILSRDIRALPNSIHIEKNDLNLTIECTDDPHTCRVGDFLYTHRDEKLDLQPLLVNPALWCGNRGIYHFAGRSILQWQRQIKHNELIHFKDIVPAPGNPPEEQELAEQLQHMLNYKEQSTLGIHFATILLRSGDESLCQTAIDYFRLVVNDQRTAELEITHHLLARPALSPHLPIKRKMLVTLLESPQLTSLEKVLRTYLIDNVNLLDSHTIHLIVERLGKRDALPELLNVMNSVFNELESGQSLEKTTIPGLLKLITQFGINHPTSYKKVRQHLVAYQFTKSHLAVAQLALQERKHLQDGFREWLGANQSVAVGPDSAEEYSWNDVLSFEEDIDIKTRERIVGIISKTPLVREAIFLFSGKRIIRLQDMLPGGIWISFIREHQHKAIYRISIQTRYQGAFDITLNLNKGIPVLQVLEEVDWLILAGSKLKAGQTLVEDFGGYYEDEGAWSEEYLVETTVAKFLKRCARKKDPGKLKRISHLWPFLVWNATTAYLRFWKLTGHEIMIAKPSAENIIIPPHDYQRGTRLVSLTDRVQETSFFKFFQSFKTYFIDQTSETYPFLNEIDTWKYFFSGMICVEGEENGKVILRGLRRDLMNNQEFPHRDVILEKLNEFLGELEDVGYNPKELTFAIRRFHRWYQVNKNASLEAQATMLNELNSTYSLYEYDKTNPDVRTRFYLQTVLEDAQPELRAELLDMARKLKHGLLAPAETHSYISRITRNNRKLTEREDYFLTRLSYPHLEPSTEAELILFEAHESTLLVQLEDQDGDPYAIRQPVSPREISKLYQLFMKANLPVHFRPEHHFLVAVSERGHIIGGLFYLFMDDNSVHMDKIVVANHFRRKGISEGLMSELFNRLKHDHIQYISTGFFRPEYFYRFGFETEAKHSGLVKSLSSNQRS